MINDQPLVTIAIPTYNRADTYLPLTFRSALQQTYSNIEIVISDNCSTDRTQAMVRGIGDPRIRYFRHDPGIGQRNNYNFCFQEARGSYILLLHDDDMIDADFVSSCVESAAADNAGVIRTGVRRIDAEGNLITQLNNDVGGLSVEAFFHGWFSGKTAIYCCNTLFSTEKLRAIGGFQSKHFCYPDTAAIFALVARYPRIDIRDVKASFRIHAGEGGFSRKLTEWCEDSLELLHFMADLAPHNREEILEEGRKFFSKANYQRATTCASPARRLVAVIKVMRYFRYRQLPSPNLVFQILYGTRLYNALRLIKRCAARPLRAIAAR
jgi:glycosyltransferase involved in cell wall biosynthesis